MRFEEAWHLLQQVGFRKLETDFSVGYPGAKRHGFKQVRTNIEKLFSDQHVWKPVEVFGEHSPTEKRMYLQSWFLNYHEPIKPKRDGRLQIRGPKKCVRCGSRKNLEREHIVALKDGGADESLNLQWMCSKDHDYKHAREKIVSAIEYTVGWRKEMWQYRLEVLDRLNPPAAKEFHSYGEDPKTLWGHWKDRYGQEVNETREKLRKEREAKRLEKEVQLDGRQLRISEMT